ncbi:MAG: heme lyase CcmF/NrfE family subunit [Pseudomonadota bacterium]|nr:heme lyase CcmF/NrfE family subunit [Pseudomonadota bacterium]
MLPEIAHLLLILAFVAAAAQAWAGLGPRAQPKLARVALAWQVAGIAGAFVLLGHAFVTDDFSVTYVVQHGNSQLPLLYKVSAIWGGHEGSLLLWVLLLALWSVAAAWRLRGMDDSKNIASATRLAGAGAGFEAQTAYATRVLGMLALVSLAMLAFVLFTSNPFMRLLPAAEDGQSLNPLLQDPGLALHPPLLYVGYVGTAVPFAMVLAVLAWGAPAGQGSWVRAMRPFVLWAWAFLSLGIGLGSWWAYYELGWGGWWFWDPVENASFMPWLVLAALAHTLAAREGRRSLPHWTAILAIGAFVLALLGLFLVRSGVITSVHAFATDPRRGVFLLGLMAAFLLGSMSLYARHASRLLAAQAPLPTALASRETAILLNNLLLTVACASVLLGTLYPLALDALTGSKISVGPPYFNAVIGPLFVALLALLMPAASLRWGQGLTPAQRRVYAAAALAVAAVAAAAWLTLRAQHGRGSVPVALTLALAAGVAVATLRWAAPRWRQMTAQQWGMCVAHLGVAVFAAGVAMVGGYGVERDVRLAPAATAAGAGAGEAAVSDHRIGGCALRFDKVQPSRGPNYAALAGHFTLQCPGEAARALVAEKRDYPGSSMPMTESAIRWGLLRDIYVALGEPLEGSPYGAWSVRVQHKPFMRWVWGGVVLMALGALLAAGGRRYRQARRVADVGAVADMAVVPGAVAAAGAGGYARHG